MPRKPAALAPARRLPPPAHLSDAGKAAWKRIVNARPADFFDPAHSSLLEAYVEAELELQHATRKLGPRAGASNAWRDVRHRASTRLAGLATKLRLTPQYATTADRAKTARQRAAADGIPDEGRSWRDEVAATQTETRH